MVFLPYDQIPVEFRTAGVKIYSGQSLHRDDYFLGQINNLCCKYIQFSSVL